MSRNCSAALKAHLAGPVTTMATCWKATLHNGHVLGFTDHTRDITFEGQLYKSATGYTPTAVEASSMLNIDNLEVEAILNSDDITEGDLLAGLWDAAEIENFWVNWNDLTMGKLVMKNGTTGQITIKGPSFVAEVRGLTQAYANQIGEEYSPLCRASLGDSRCTKSLALYTGGGTVQAIDSGNRLITDSARTEAGPAGGVAITGVSRALKAKVTAPGHTFANGSEVSIYDVVGVVQVGSEDEEDVFQNGSGGTLNGYSYTISDVVSGVSFTIPVDTRLASADAADGPAFNLQYSAYISGGTARGADNTGFYDFGKVTFTSGLNINLSMEVKNYNVGLIELQLPMPYPVEVGDTYTIVAGCGKRFTEDCLQKFNNVLNFRGEPHMPGVDQLMRVGGPPEVDPDAPITAPVT